MFICSLFPHCCSSVGKDPDERLIITHILALSCSWTNINITGRGRMVMLTTALNHLCIQTQNRITNIVLVIHSHLQQADWVVSMETSIPNRHGFQVYKCVIRTSIVDENTYEVTDLNRYKYCFISRKVNLICFPSLFF